MRYRVFPGVKPRPGKTEKTKEMSLRLRPVFGMAFLLGSAIVFAQCGGGSPTAPAPVVTVGSQPAGHPSSSRYSRPGSRTDVPTVPPVIPAPGSSSTFVNVLGDTGWCGSPALGPLSRLFDRFDGDILLAGDLAYPSGTMEEFRNCFEPSFGKFKSRMRASPGHHATTSRRSAPILLLQLLRRTQRPQSARLLRVSCRRMDGADAELERADQQDVGAVSVCPHRHAADADALHDGGRSIIHSTARASMARRRRCETSGS